MFPNDVSVSNEGKILDGVTKSWLHSAAQLTELPVCLRSQLMYNSLKLSQLGEFGLNNSFVKSDVCQNCRLKYDKFNAKFFIQLRHVKGQRRRK